jgi:hypothetical protein
MEHKINSILHDNSLESELYAMQVRREKELDTFANEVDRINFIKKSLHHIVKNYMLQIAKDKTIPMEKKQVLHELMKKVQR